MNPRPVWHAAASGKRAGAGQISAGVFNGPERSREKLKLILSGFLMAAFLCAHGFPVRGVIFFGTADPSHNTTAPAGELHGSGWEVQGEWGQFLGAPIAPNYFITAGHVGGQVGGTFFLDGIAYVTDAVFDHAESDLRIWRICGTFPRTAPLYTKKDEVGKGLVVFGRGTRRGTEVAMPGLLGESRKGWRWGEADQVKRWGENVAGSVVQGDVLGMIPLGTGSGNFGELLKVPFDAGGGLNEAHLSHGDSGGGVFMKEDGVWKLAGINLAVEGPYNTSASGPGFHGAIFDKGGLYEGGEGKWLQNPDLPTNQPGAFFATRISSNLDWIESILNLPASDAVPKLQGTSNLATPFADKPENFFSVASESRTIRFPVPERTEFYRLRSCAGSRVTAMTVEDGMVVLRYE